MNARLWAWCESVYHSRPHTGLNGEAPIERWRKEIVHVRHLSPGIIERLDDVFFHRSKRRVKKDATVSWEGHLYEVPHQQVGEEIMLIVDPHVQKVVRAETLHGDNLSIAPLDRKANAYRKRQRPHDAFTLQQQTKSAVEIAYEDYLQNITGFTTSKEN